MFEVGDIIRRKPRATFAGCTAVVIFAGGGDGIKLEWLDGPKIGQIFVADPNYCEIVDKDVNLDAD